MTRRCECGKDYEVVGILDNGLCDACDKVRVEQNKIEQAERERIRLQRWEKRHKISSS